MKDARPFEGIVSDKRRSDLSDQTRLSILSWNVGPMGETVADSVEGSFHVIMVQEAETVCHEIITNAEQRFHIYQGADQLILYHAVAFVPVGVKMHQENPRTSKQDSFGLRDLLVKSRIRRRPKEESSTYTAVSGHPSNTTAKRRDVALQLLGWLRKVAEKNHCRQLHHLGLPRTRECKSELDQRSMGGDPLGSSAGRGPDERIRRLLRLHADKKR